MSVSIIAEIGINHNGSVELAKQLIMVAKTAGCNYVKFQKRTPNICVPEHQKNKLKSTPWGEMTYLDYKYKVEFEEKEYDEILEFCKSIGIGCFASVWDKNSVDFMTKYTKFGKIPSALITNDELCIYARKRFDKLLISTGMSTEEEIEHCVSICNPDVIFHTNSTYPSPVTELNLNYILHLIEKYPSKEIGYSGHEYGLVTTYATIPMGVKWIERHITLNRNMWGSDHKASVEPSGIFKLVKGIRDIESSISTPRNIKRILYKSELEKRKSLRG
jgi:N-acetylneuraminate synthase